MSPRGTKETQVPFTKKDAMLGYRLMEARSEFPANDMAKYVPLSWNLSTAIAGGLSLDAGCEYCHILTNASLRLSCVKVPYSGMLGVFPNIMVLQDGASGDGKSIGLWFDTQVNRYLRKKVLARRMVAWRKIKISHDEWKTKGEEGCEPELPGKEPTMDELFDGGSTYGLGQQMSRIMAWLSGSNTKPNRCSSSCSRVVHRAPWTILMRCASTAFSKIIR